MDPAFIISGSDARAFVGHTAPPPSLRVQASLTSMPCAACGACNWRWRDADVICRSCGNLANAPEPLTAETYRRTELVEDEHGAWRACTVLETPRTRTVTFPRVSRADLARLALKGQERAFEQADVGFLLAVENCDTVEWEKRTARLVRLRTLIEGLLPPNEAEPTTPAKAAPPSEAQAAALD